MAVTEKRPLDDNVYSTKHIVMDIEGTTTSISFVKDTLFPYVRQNLSMYLSSHWDEDEFKTVLALLKEQAAEDKKADMEGAVEIPEGSDDDAKAAVAKNVLWQMDTDRKTTALKKLQGHMWRQGYKDGKLKGHIFSDVAPALRQWVKDGRKLYVYSSGSVEAQKLLFGNSAEGDLTELFTDFFDTEVGAKVNVESYKSIVKRLDCQADDVLFLTDVPKEASAAREAGLPAILVEREGNEPITGDLRKEFSAVSSFQDLEFEATSKKQKIEEGDGDAANKSAEEGDAAMEVDTVVESVIRPEVAAPQTETMDVEKPREESTVEAVVPAANMPENEGSSKCEENGVQDVEKENDLQKVKVDTPDAGEKNMQTPTEEVKKETEDEAKGAEPAEKFEKTEELDSAVVTEDQDLKDAAETKETDVTEKTDEQVPQKTDVGQSAQNVETESKDLPTMERDETESVESKPLPEAEQPAPKQVECDSNAAETMSEVKLSIVGEAEVKEKPTETKADEKEATETIESAVEREESMKSVDVEVQKSAKNEEKSFSEDGKESPEIEARNGDKVEKVGDEGKVNGVLNGTSNGTKALGTNGTVANGHNQAKDDIPEVIVAKTTPQVENSSSDSGVVVET